MWFCLCLYLGHWVHYSLLVQSFQTCRVQSASQYAYYTLQAMLCNNCNCPIMIIRMCPTLLLAYLSILHISLSLINIPCFHFRFPSFLPPPLSSLLPSLHRSAHPAPDSVTLPPCLAHSQRQRECSGQVHHLQSQEDLHGLPPRVLPPSLDAHLPQLVTQ